MSLEKRDKDQKDKSPEKKPDKEKKPGILKNMTRSFREMRGEVKKVVWPTKKQIFNNTGVVIVVVAISGAIIGALDFVLKVAVDFLLRAA